MTTLALRPLPRTPARSGLLETLAFFRDPDFAPSRFRRYGNVFETVILGQPQVFVRGEGPVLDLLSQPEALEGWWPGSVRTLLGSLSLANRNGPGHRARRRVIGQLFAAVALRRYAPSIVAEVDRVAADLETGPSPRQLAPIMRRFAFSVIASTVLGLEGEEREELFHDFELWTRGLFRIPLALPGSAYARALRARRRLLNRLRGVLQRAQRPPGGTQPRRPGGLDLLAGGLDEAGVPLSDADVVEQLLLLLFAGYETTASSLSCLMRALLLHPQVMLWLQEELDSLPWPPEDGMATTFCDPARAPRLDAVVKEVMRLTPPVGGFFRRTTRPIGLGGVAVPADRVVQVSIAATHRLGDPDEDLEAFRPQRHLGAGSSALLLPFGGGERVCLGKALAELEIRLMAVGLLRRLRLELEPGQDLDLLVVPSPTPRDGLRVRAHGR